MFNSYNEEIGIKEAAETPETSTEATSKGVTTYNLQRSKNTYIQRAVNMPSWHLHLLLILTVIHPIFSEHSSIDGGRCCIHTPLTEENFDPRGHHQLGKLHIENSSPHDRNENRNIQRDAAREKIQTIRLIDDRRLERYTLTPHERIRSTGDRASYRLVRDGNRSNARSQYYKNTGISDKATFIGDDKSKVNGIYDNSFDRHHRKQDLTRTSENYGLNDHGHVGANSYIRNSNDDIIKDKHIIRLRDNSSKSLKYDFRENENERNNNRDNSNTEKHEKENRNSNEPTDIKKSERFLMENTRVDRDAPKKNIRGIMHRNNVRDRVKRDINERITDRDMARNHEGRKADFRHEVSDIRNFEKYSRDNVRESEYSLERGIRQANIRRIMNRNMIRDRVERNINERNEPKEVRNSERYSRYNTRHALLTLERGVSRESSKRITDQEMFRNHEEQKTNIRNKQKDIRNFERYSREYYRDTTPSLERGTRIESLIRIADRDMALNREKRNIIDRNEHNNRRNSERYSRINTLNSASSSERGISVENMRNIMDRNMARDRVERNINERNHPNDMRNSERYSRDNVRDAASSLERGERRENLQRITDQDMGRNREQRKMNFGNELNNIRNFERYARDNVHDSASTLERDTRRESSIKIAYRDMALKREKRSIIDRNEHNNRRNSERYSRVNTLNSASSSECGISDENMRNIMDRNIARDRVERNINERNQPNDMRKSERYSRDNVRDAASSLERGVHRENSPRITDQQMGRNREERKMKDGNESNDIRTFERYSRDNRGVATTLERGIRRENSQRITNQEMARNREGRKMNVRNEPNDIRNFERYSRDNVRNSASTFERDTRRQSSIRIVDRDMALNREKLNINERNEPNNRRNSERYSRVNTLNSASSTERGISDENVRNIMDRNMARDRVERNINERNQLNDMRNSERYSRDNVRDAASSLERGVRRENLQRITDQYMGRNREQRKMNTRNELNDIRNFERYSRDNIRGAATTLERGVRRENSQRITDQAIARNREERKMNVRNEPKDITNFERYVRDNVRYSASTLERGTRRQSSIRIVDRDMALNREKRNINERNGPNYRKKSEMYSGVNTLNSASSSVRGISDENIRNIMDRNMARDRVERNVNERNQPNDMMNSERYLRDNVRDAASSLEHGVRRENSQRITDQEMGRNSEERKMNVSNKYNDIRTFKRYSRDNVRGAATTLERGVRRENSQRITDQEMARNREERKMNVRNEPNDIMNFKRYSRKNVRDSAFTLERGTPRQSSVRIVDRDMALNREKRNINERNEPNNRKKSERYSRVITGVVASSLERDIRQEYVRNIMERNMIRDRVERNTNRNQVNDMRNSVSVNKSERNAAISLDLGVRRENLIRITDRDIASDHEQRNVHTHMRKSERYSRDIPHDKTPSGKFERYIKKNTHETVIPGERISRHKDSNHELSRRHIELTHTLRSSTIKKPIVTEITKNEVSICGWQYFFYALQGVYIIGIIMQERVKISSLDWLTSSSLLKVN